MNNMSKARLHRVKQYIGMRFGKLVVTGIAQPYIRKSSKTRLPELSYKVTVKCDCGLYEEHFPHRLKSKIKQCHCCTKKAAHINPNRKPIKLKVHTPEMALYNKYATSTYHRHKSVGNAVLTFNEWLKISVLNCFYCGKEPIFVSPYRGRNIVKGMFMNGIDRVDSKIGYIPENCVPCCRQCNYSKHLMSLEEFKTHITRIYKHLIK